MTTPAILRLPQELIVRVSSFLTTVDLGHFRRSCKQIVASLFESFAKEFFSKRQFMVEEISLQALLDIADHPILSHKLKEVIISCHKFEKGPDLLRALYSAGHVERNVLIATGQARDMLKEAFSKLPNLRTVGLRDYDGAGRVRDGPDARWRSYGWSFSSLYVGSNEDVDTTFALLLSALAHSDARPRSLEVFLRRSAQLCQRSFEIPLRGPLARCVPEVLASLQTVMLALSLDTVHPNPVAIFDPLQAYDDSNVVDAGLRRFLHHISNVESLRLNFRQHELLAVRLLEWLGRDVATPQVHKLGEPTALIIPTVQLDNLTRLDIGMAHVPCATLVKVLTKFHLASFSLWKVSLHTQSRKVNPWKQFLTELARQLCAPSRLRSIMIGYGAMRVVVNQALVGVDGVDVPVYSASQLQQSSDKSKAEMPALAKFEQQFTASSPHQWLEELAQKTSIPAQYEAESESANEASDLTEDESIDEMEDSGDEED